VITASLSGAISTWPWSMVSAFAAIAGLGILVYVNFLRPLLRRQKLKEPVEAHFLIPAKKHHGCDFARQDEEEHVTKSITLPSNRDVIVDLRFKPRIFFSSSEIGLGCEGNREDIPYAFEYFNRFIEDGDGQRVTPGPGNRHYVDKHHYYHLRESTRYWSRGTSVSFAFNFRTHAPGRYPLMVSFIGDEIEGNNYELMIIVEDNPQSIIRCVDAGHRNRSCARGIQPIPMSK
jgi:hypothetical protein